MKKTEENAAAKVQNTGLGQSRDTITGLLNHMEGMSESGRILYDEIFKTMFQYKYVVAKVLKAASSDFASYSMDELVVGICDVSARQYAGNKELYTSKIEVLNLEDKSPGEKEIRYDLVFQMRLPDKTGSGKPENVLVNFTIDLEMQKENPGYSLPARAIYYAASLLRNTLQPGEDYSHIHKVCSIWFCGCNCIKGALSEQHYRHSYRMVRDYGEWKKAETGLIRKAKSEDEIPAEKSDASGEGQGKTDEMLVREAVVDQEADLMEVIFIELQKQDQLEECEIAELGEALKSIFKNPTQTLQELTDRFGPLDHLTMNQEVKEMISMEKFGEITRREGREEGIQEEIVRSIRFCYQRLLASGKSGEEAIKMTADLLGWKECDIRKFVGEQLAS